MKKKLTIALVCVLTLTLLFTSIASAAIPSSKTSSGTFVGNGAAAVGYIYATSAKARTTYGIVPWNIYARCTVYWTLNGVDDYATRSTGYLTGETIAAVQPPYPDAPDDTVFVETWQHIAYNDQFWRRYMTYNDDPGNWMVYTGW